MSKITYRIVIALVVTAGCQSSAGNITGAGGTKASRPYAGAFVVSGDFEDLPAGGLNGFSRPWAAEEAFENSVQQDSSAAHGGSKYVLMAGSTSQLMTGLDLQPHTGYRVSAWVGGTPGIYQSATQDSWIRGMFVSPHDGIDTDGPDGDTAFDQAAYVKSVPIATGDGSWRQISLTFNTGDSAAWSVHFDAILGDALLKVDDVTIAEEAVPEHPTLNGYVSGNNVNLNWTGPAGLNYVIFRGDYETEFLMPFDRTQGTSYVDSTAIPGRLYAYEVAIDEGNDVFTFAYQKLYLTPGTCTPDCTGKVCGSDGCSGSCGDCPSGQSCDSSGQCVDSTCTPDCTGKVCGSDGCSGSCGDCPSGQSCDSSGQCVDSTCTPDCTGRVCGSDGCSGSCGDCPSGQSCDTSSGQCLDVSCDPNCPLDSCGSQINGCGDPVWCGDCVSANPSPSAPASGRWPTSHARKRTHSWTR
jgi:hypothetical protein